MDSGEPPGKVQGLLNYADLNLTGCVQRTSKPVNYWLLDLQTMFSSAHINLILTVSVESDRWWWRQKIKSTAWHWGTSSWMKPDKSNSPPRTSRPTPTSSSKVSLVRLNITWHHYWPRLQVQQSTCNVSDTLNQRGQQKHFSACY